MKQKTKEKARKIANKIFWIIWILIGFFIALITFLLYLKMQSINNLGVLAVAMLFAAGIYIFFIYIGITLLILLIKFIIKMIKNRKNRKKRK